VIPYFDVILDGIWNIMVIYFGLVFFVVVYGLELLISFMGYMKIGGLNCYMDTSTNGLWAVLLISPSTSPIIDMSATMTSSLPSTSSPCHQPRHSPCY